jgi:hypothetical protein
MGIITSQAVAGQVIAQINVGDPPFVLTPTSDYWTSEGVLLQGLTGVILCVDMWGAGGIGGNGVSIGDGFIGGGGAAGSFNRVYIQSQKTTFDSLHSLTDVELSISANGIELNIIDTPEDSASLAAAAGEDGSNWGRSTSSQQPQAGASSWPTMYNAFDQTSGTDLIYSSNSTLPHFPSDLPVIAYESDTVYASSTILSTSDLQPISCVGTAGLGGFSGGVGGAPTEVGGVRAGWGGTGNGRSTTDLVVAPGPAIAIVYLVATTSVQPPPVEPPILA